MACLEAPDGLVASSCTMAIMATCAPWLQIPRSARGLFGRTPATASRQMPRMPRHEFLGSTIETPENPFGFCLKIKDCLLKLAALPWKHGFSTIVIHWYWVIFVLSLNFQYRRQISHSLLRTKSHQKHQSIPFNPINSPLNPRGPHEIIIKIRIRFNLTKST